MTLDLLARYAKFLDITPKTWATNENIDKLNVIEIKNLCASKDKYSYL